MTIKDSDVGFGKPTVVVKPKFRPIRVKVVCDDCGEEGIERKFYCRWDVAAQDWVVHEWDDSSDDYCPHCQGEVCSTDVRIGVEE